jgi:hypothetical protein
MTKCVSQKRLGCCGQAPQSAGSTNSYGGPVTCVSLCFDSVSWFLHKGWREHLLFCIFTSSWNHSLSSAVSILCWVQATRTGSFRKVSPQTQSSFLSSNSPLRTLVGEWPWWIPQSSALSCFPPVQKWGFHHLLQEIHPQSIIFDIYSKEIVVVEIPGLGMRLNDLHKGT